ncbi:hypothetical protein [Hydrogenophaga sp.]|uniref:hypothetical protein n=1 Tax=Hydrogenophaga sp. TaxID=1904254 RepID=UPI002AB99208|nr:hypothetical protein [Hydrogenophaga sp.]MDZ4400424.1 hypothetical protein [Hydrogenophaga sp.]
MPTTRCILIGATLAFWTLVNASTARAQEIEWHVINRFPLFIDSKAFESIEREWGAAQGAADFIDQPGITMKLRDLLPIRATAWNPISGTYDKKILFREQHEIRARAVGFEDGSICSWRIDDGAALSAPCTASPPLKVPAGQPFTIVASSAGGTEMRQEVRPIKESLVVAMGDSFASGEGNPDHPAILKALTPSVRWQIEQRPARFIVKGAEWWDEACHRSLLSWPALSALARAMKEKKEVVQFASFACSGAEVYDGILRAQVDPPGDHAGYLVKSSSWTKRDGGQGYKNSTNKKNTNYDVGQIHKQRLRLSQQHALAQLVCSGNILRRLRTNTPEPAPGVTLQQWYFGDIEIRACNNPRQVDQLLLSIGGNDVGFSGIVRWLITPPTAKNSLNKFFLGFARKEGGVVEPQQARQGIASLPAIYAVLGTSLSVLKVPQDRVLLLQYPNPAGSLATLDRCNKRTREGNVPMQALVYSKIGNADFLFGVNPNEYRSLDHEFVKPLRQVQVDSSKALGWKLLDSQASFTPDGSASRDYCGVATSCVSSVCELGDRVRWWPKSPYSTDPHLPTLAAFDAYDPSRTRGMRYGVDALLAGVAPSGKNGGIRGDWLFGTAHPTANLHGRIADQVTLRTDPAK